MGSQAGRGSRICVRHNMPCCVNAVHVAKCRIFGTFAAYKKRVARDFAQIAHTKKEPGGSRCQVSQGGRSLLPAAPQQSQRGAGVMVMLRKMQADLSSQTLLKFHFRPSDFYYTHKHKFQTVRKQPEIGAGAWAGRGSRGQPQSPHLHGMHGRVKRKWKWKLIY